MFTRIISGGQTGVDRAALDVALELGLDCGGWCPLGRRAEDGPIPARYPLRETPTDEYRERTEWNVRDSDATLVLGHGELSGGTLFTTECAAEHARPLLVIDLEAHPDAALARHWIEATKPQVLNIAGPREESVPGIHHKAY